MLTLGTHNVMMFRGGMNGKLASENFLWKEKTMKSVSQTIAIAIEKIWTGDCKRIS